MAKPSRLMIMFASALACGPEPTVTQADASSDSSGAPDPIQPACIDAHPEACPPGCSPATVHRVVGPSCETEEEGVCIEDLADPAEHPTTYYASIGGAPAFLEILGCGPDRLPRAGWTECGGENDAPGCECFCDGSHCPGEEQIAMLDACGLPSPCPVARHNDGDPEDPAAADCVLDAMIAGESGVFSVVGYTGGSRGTTRFYSHGGVVHRARLPSDDTEVCPLMIPWEQVERCQLAPPEWFEGCRAMVGPESCLERVDEWTTDCEVAAPTCR